MKQHSRISILNTNKLISAVTRFCLPLLYIVGQSEPYQIEYGVLQNILFRTDTNKRFPRSISALKMYFPRLHNPTKMGISNTTDYETLKNPWRQVLSEYTSCNWTYPAADKLLALSAITSRMGELMNYLYIAEHFGKELAYSLGWKRCHPGMLQKATYRMTRLQRQSHNEHQETVISTPSWS